MLGAAVACSLLGGTERRIGADAVSEAGAAVGAIGALLGWAGASSLNRAAPPKTAGIRPAQQSGSIAAQSAKAN